MIRLLCAAAAVLLTVSPVQAQVVQWADKVIGVSSELTPVQYAARQVLGKPNVMPAGGQNPNAWTPDRPKRKEWIKVGFANPIQIRQIAIAESHNPSALTAVTLYDEKDNAYRIRETTPVVVPRLGRMINIIIEQTPYKVAAVRLDFDGSALPDYFSIDAIAISDSPFQITPLIDRPELLADGILVERLDEKVNSEYTELNPLLSPDGKTLYFSRRNHPENMGGVNDKEDIWYSELGNDGRWTLAKNAGPVLNNEYPNFVNAVSSATPDGKSVILVLGNQYGSNGKMVAGVSMSNNVNGMWSSPTPIRIKNDYNFSEKANYFLANTRTTLLMSVEREDSQGGRDLYVSFMEKDSTWTEPLNLGSVVNTAGEESAPFLASDNQTLYFSSNGFSGYGGADVYMSKRLDDTWLKWSEPKNMGPDINGKTDDLFFNIPNTSDFAYYSRGITNDNMDIFRAKLPFYKAPEPYVVVRGRLVDSKTGQPIGAKIIYERLPDGKQIGIAQSNPQTGEYEITLPGGQLYGVRAEAENHISESQNLDLRHVKKDETLDHQDFSMKPDEKTLADIGVTPIGPAATITLNNIFFDFAKAVLKPESFSELNRLVTLLKERPAMEVEVAGHADASGPDSYNLLLSQFRARAVTRYLTGQGIAESRIKTTFFGESKPAVSNDTREGRTKNRRVEFIILKL
jgi:outer membrane protein OmpA-like peptidoglycan-associated protein